MELLGFWTGADMIFTVIFLLSLLVILYAMALMNRAIRVLQYQVTVIENDIKIMSEEFKMIANRERIDPSKVDPYKNDQDQEKK